jgi:hypothetical protein
MVVLALAFRPDSAARMAEHVSMAVQAMPHGVHAVSNRSSETKKLYTTRQYPCGCKAEGPGDVPAYCDIHGLPPELEDPIKVMERGRFLAGYVDDAHRYRWLRDHIALTICARIEKTITHGTPEKLDELIDERRAT